MPWKRTSWTLLVSLALVLASCGREEATPPWEAGPGGSAPEGAVRIVSVVGATGDVQVTYSLTPPDGGLRNVTLFYRGACPEDQDWKPAFTGDAQNPVGPGSHALTWHSWDQAAGCRGEVRVRVATDIEGESAEWGPFLLDNSRPGEDGFFQTPLTWQGIDDIEAPFFDWALTALLADPTVDFVATRYYDTYEVHAARGSVVFRRVQTHAGYQYVVDQVTGQNPIAVQDPTLFATYEAEIFSGHNPNHVSYPEFGYPEGDPRVSFVEPENDSYPFGYERIAAYFDHPDAADFMVNWKGYAHTGAVVDGDVQGLGEHGSLNIFQSRSPLVFWGAGVRPGGGAGLYTRQVDIAPTVARLLGFPRTYGVDERGIWSHNVRLTWQDGHAIEEVLTGEEAGLVIVLVCDGLAHTEFQRQVRDRPDRLPYLARLVREGAMIEYGSTTNWPSVTYPSHNVIGSGVYSGHHGLVDNAYYLREQGEVAAPIRRLVLTDKFWKPAGPAETLHEAIHRLYGDWNVFGDGAFTASLLNPSVHGADKADIEFRDESGEVPFPPFGLDAPYETPKPNLRFLDTLSVLGEEILVELAMIEFYHLFQSDAIGVPRYIIVDVMPTDGGGHAFGPHGNDMDTVLSFVDDVVAATFIWLDALGLRDEAAIVLTSDHGMQIGDVSRSGWPIDSLKAAGVPIQDGTWLGVYLKMPDLEVEGGNAEEGEPIAVRAVDRYSRLPIVGATIEIAGGESMVTDADGRAILPPPDVDPMALTVSRSDYCRREFRLAAGEVVR